MELPLANAAWFHSEAPLVSPVPHLAESSV